MTNQKCEKLLQTVHPYSIYQYNGKWCTYLSDDSRASKRRRVLRKEAELLDYLFEHYQLSDPEDNAKMYLYERYTQTGLSIRGFIQQQFLTFSGFLLTGLPTENTKIVKIFH